MKQKLVVCAVIVNEAAVLVVHREIDSMEGNKWEFPGGKVEFGEDPAVSLKREIMEELNLTISVGNPIAISADILGGDHYIMIALECEIIGGDLFLNVGQNYQWVRPIEFENLEWAALDIPMLDRIREYIEQTSRNP